MVFIFENMSLDPERRELRSGSTLITIEPKVFDLLEFLIRNRDRVVSREDLVASTWGGSVVSDSAIGVRINAARRAIGDDGEQQRWIRTVARKGFRFVGDIREESGAGNIGLSGCVGGPTNCGSRPVIRRLRFAGLRTASILL
jgi:DNA-binding winged helix-turn-helix (wHTH) protein